MLNNIQTIQGWWESLYSDIYNGRILTAVVVEYILAVIVLSVN